ncbi:uncharacterized protein LOC120658131 [Panicum virgatum]|uniref:uncharacterized protein LOC120658131 n=1 Tax=Panicum virgatum TaxID=38727 RepID=UPI0019D5F100|nr:uncharacterized protein LOC120658131 [Panicum virgatum]
MRSRCRHASPVPATSVTPRSRRFSPLPRLRRFIVTPSKMSASTSHTTDSFGTDDEHDSSQPRVRRSKGSVDMNKPPETISGNMTAAMCVYSRLFMRYMENKEPEAQQ